MRAEPAFLATVTVPGVAPGVAPARITCPAWWTADLPTAEMNGSYAVRAEDYHVLVFDRRFGWGDTGLVYVP